MPAAELLALLGALISRDVLDGTLIDEPSCLGPERRGDSIESTDSCNLLSPLSPPHSPLAIVRWRTGITGTTIKDTWTKSRGRVELGKGGGFGWGRVEGWGEKAYNCN